MKPSTFQRRCSLNGKIWYRDKDSALGAAARLSERWHAAYRVYRCTDRRCKGGWHLTTRVEER